MARSAKTATKTARRALVVAGMHRSGTSAMARLLSLSGASLPERVMAPAADNPAGFWEPWEMVALNDRILASCESSWDDVFAVQSAERAAAQAPTALAEAQAFVTANYGAADLMVMKDPRSSVLAPLWSAALEGLGIKPLYVIMVRNPLAVARSLLKRNGFSTEKSVLLWTSYMLAVERDTRGLDRLFVSYDAMLDDWRSALAAVEVALGQPLPRTADEAAADIEGFLNRSYRHHEATAEDLSARAGIWPGALSVFAWFDAAVRGAAPPTKVLDAVAAKIADLESVMGPVCADMRREILDLRVEATQAVGLRAELEAAGSMLSRLHEQADAASQRAEAARLHAEAVRVQTERDLGWLRDEGAMWRQRAASEQAEQEREAAAAHLRAAGLEAFASAQAGHIVQLQEAVATLQSSTSWRLTAPLRWVIQRFRSS